MIEDMTDDERIQREYTEALHASLSTTGPKGEDLAKKLSAICNGYEINEVLVALTLIRCFLEDSTKMPRDQFGYTAHYIYAFIRAQADKVRTMQ